MSLGRKSECSSEDLVAAAVNLLAPAEDPIAPAEDPLASAADPLAQVGEWSTGPGDSMLLPAHISSPAAMAPAAGEIALSARDPCGLASEVLARRYARPLGGGGRWLGGSCSPLRSRAGALAARSVRYGLVPSATALDPYATAPIRRLRRSICPLCARSVRSGPRSVPSALYPSVPSPDSSSPPTANLTPSPRAAPPRTAATAARTRAPAAAPARRRPGARPPTG